MENIAFDSTQAITRNDILCRRHLSSSEANGITRFETLESSGDMIFFKISGITRFWESDTRLDFSSIMGDVITGLVRYGISLGFVMIGTMEGINFYIGISRPFSEELLGSLCAYYPGIDLEEGYVQKILHKNLIYGGCITGYPTNKEDKENRNFQVENICKGMMGKDWAYMILAKGMSNIQVGLAHDKILDEMKSVNSFIRSSVAGGPMGNQTMYTIDFSCQNYLTNIRLMESTIKDGCARGMWRVNGYYAAPKKQDADKLRNIIKSAYSGKDSAPEVFRCLPHDNISSVMDNFYMVSDLDNRAMFHPVGVWIHPNFQKPIDFCKYQYQTVMNSDQLASMCQISTKEYPGFYVDDYVEFDNSNRVSYTDENCLNLGDIMFSGRNARKIIDNKYNIDLNDLTRHALIIGVTGGGKTNTSKYLLSELWLKHKKPFLVIESAKREYWELSKLEGFKDLVLFTFGSEVTGESVKYRINPFEVIGRVSLQTHIDYLLSTFKASFELFVPMPYVLETAVYEVYSDRGWDIVENKNLYGLKEYPTLTDLYNKIDIVTERLGYHDEIKSNVKAALRTRINSLRIGGKGAMLDTPRSVPIEMILKGPTVLELEDLGDDDTKAFVIGILLVQLYEYRRSNMYDKRENPDLLKNLGSLEHVLIVEEAHRLLKDIPMNSEASNTRAKSVEFFCNLLAEIRSFGQGIFISDQIPTKLAPDTLKNTNLKIVHRTVMQEDREIIGKSMNMTPEQINYLSSLRRGFAAVYAEGDSRPKLVKMPLIENKYGIDRKTVLNNVRKNLDSLIGSYDKKYSFHAGCSFCDNRCKYKQLEKILEDRLTRDTVVKFLPVLNKYKFRPKTINAMVAWIAGRNNTLTVPEKICIIGKTLTFINLPESRKMQAVVDYMKFYYGGGQDG